ncbi:thioredoxin family protein [Methanocalculus taiwanensis]|uniref:Thioredoxin family protein n=1 Tax=Methanocalculus taiwanensis TaxID=106207 RepID=A0ABD4TJN1_9EURY|nr:thioredoxin family protein [Methanocalculus taiwanensis]MCQ1538030.1 thioredoxin family protein [Methanocalculus taiwanensis]
MAVSILSFYQEGCMGCLEQEPINAEVSANMSVSIESIDAKEHPEYIKTYGLKVTPTTVILVDGSMVEKVEGVLHQEEFCDLLKKYL